ncbi:MAG: polyphosphate kinase 2 [Mesorhizobium sp.]|nr:polyphosphate kinase 2 [Mesorhizobium sp.]
MATEKKNTTAEKPQPAGMENLKPLKLTIAGKERVFDIDNPKLPDWIDKHSMTSGNYAYEKKLPGEEYIKTIEALQVELVKLQYWMQKSGQRVVVLFEGRDAAGKGGTIAAVHQYMNPRTARNVALTKPTETERGQWYYQRYVAHFPSAGEFVTFDRSWYNRAGVEKVMGFCTPYQYEKFLAETPGFEQQISNEGIHFFKIWLNIGQEMQLERFHDRRHSPLKNWKFSPIDVAGIKLWDDYTKARDIMMERTHSLASPWTIVRSNDKRRARIAVIRHLLSAMSYEGRNDAVIGTQDANIIGSGPDFLIAGEKGPATVK